MSYSPSLLRSLLALAAFATPMAATLALQPARAAELDGSASLPAIAGISDRPSQITPLSPTIFAQATTDPAPAPDALSPLPDSSFPDDAAPATDPVLAPDAPSPANPTVDETEADPPGDLPPAEPAVPPPAADEAESDEAQPPDALPTLNDAETQTAPPETGEDALPPSPPNETDTPGQETTDAPPEREVLVAEVVVDGADDDLTNTVYEAISTRPGQTTTRSQLQVDINAIFATGFFSAVRAVPSDTPLGVRVTFLVRPNPVLRSVQVAGSEVLPEEKVTEIFSPQYGKTLNLRDLQTGIKAVNQYYQDSGFVLGQVVGSPQIDADGTVTLQVAEGVIEDIEVRHKNEEGEPKKGRTRKFIITREMRTKPGDVLNRDRLQNDLQTVFGLGLFEDIQVALEPGEDPRKVVVNLDVQEKSTGNFSAGAGFSSNSGLFGTASYTQNNLGGNNQKLNTQIQIGTREILFDASFTDPWIATDPYRTSYTVNIFNRLTRPLVFDGGETDINLGDAVPINQDGILGTDDDDGFVDSDETPRVNRLGGGVVFSRPLTKDPDKIATAWRASAGIQYQRVSIRDVDFDVVRFDELGNDLSFSGTGQDDLLMVQLGLSKDLRNDPLTPTKGSVLRLGLDQSIPVGLGSITMTRLRASYSYFVPVKLINFTPGPQALAFNVQGGTVIGDLPPYEAFTLGGGSSVRGYDEGDVGSGRSFIQATAEYRFPLLKFLGGIGGVLFVDYGSLLGTQDDVPGNPGIVRGKPGQGFGYGVGVRVKTPIGPVRLDYGWNDQGDSRFQFGFGERF